MRFFILIAFLVGCTAPPNKRCKEICDQQFACVDDRGEQYFDRGDCVSRCDALAKSEQGKTLVEGIAECGKKYASDCVALLNCSNDHVLPPVSTACRTLCTKKTTQCGKGTPGLMEQCMGKCVDRAQNHADRVLLRKDFECSLESDCKSFGECLEKRGKVQ